MKNSPKRNKYLKLLGEIITDFSRLESFLKIYVGYFISNDYELNVCITSDTSLFNLLTLLDALVRYRLPDKLTEFKVIFDNIDELRKNRNHYVHDEWFIEEFDNQIISRLHRKSKKGNKGIQFTIKNVDISELKSFHKAINATHNEVSLFIRDNISTIKKHCEQTKNKDFMESMSKIQRTETKIAKTLD
jgi:hypothetical protein